MSHLDPSLLPKGPVVLAIMDGVGLGGGEEDDAVVHARTPTLDRWRANCPFLALRAHGTAVGLPSDGDMGNSEVGHNAMGAGRIYAQGATRVNAAIADGSAFESTVWKKLVGGNTLHLLGLVSDGNVHSNVEHVYQLIERAIADGVTRIRVHGLTDGRDVAARSALTWFGPLEDFLASLSSRGVDASIASGGGRMHMTMDRYQADWAMVERGWKAHVQGHGRQFASACEAIQTLYDEDPNTDDQWLPSFVIGKDGEPVGTIEDGDSVLMFNFRGDRAIEISQAFSDDHFEHFDRGDRPDVYYAGMMEYDGDLHVPSNYLVSPPAIHDTVGQRLVAAGASTFACSETQKFGHVTFFFNGNRSGTFDDGLETYKEVPSDNRPFNEAPWMKAAEVTDACIEAIRSGRYQHVRLNYPNGDMVGHTGDLNATLIAVESVDLQLARLEKAVLAAGGILLVTADHGNADEMYMRKKGKVLTDESGAPLARTSHSLNEVPFLLVGADPALRLRQDLDNPGIGSVGSTILQLCGVPVPEQWLPALVQDDKSPGA